MSIFESIHAERKLSLNHWRYRLLHWCFDETAKRPEDSSLPRFLYTHYCPLFHLTNLIVLFIWLILLFKVLYYIVGKLYDIINNLEFKNPDALDNKQVEFAFLIRLIAQRPHASFEQIWSSSNFILLSEEEARNKYDQVIERIRAAHEKAERKKEKRMQRMIFWVNFSRIFIRCFFYVLYAMAAVAMAVAFTYCLQPVVDFFKWLFSSELGSIIPLLIFMAKAAVAVAVSSTVIFLLYRFEMGSTVLKGLKTVTLPFALFWDMLAATAKCVVKGFRNFTSFIHTLYEESCPPIVIVSEEDEIIETSVENSI